MCIYIYIYIYIYNSLSLYIYIYIYIYVYVYACVSRVCLVAIGPNGRRSHRPVHLGDSKDAVETILLRGPKSKKHKHTSY